MNPELTDPYLPIHQRLLERDPLAPSDLADAILDQVLVRVRKIFPELAHETILDDSVADAVLGYAERPHKFDPSRLSLLSYLTMSARGDVLNALDARKRRRRREVSLEVVEESPAARKRLSDHANTVAAADETVVEQAEIVRISAHIKEAIRSPMDGRVIHLLIDGERRTEVFADVLGVRDLDPAAQRRTVKQYKDRIKKRLERLGVPLDERQTT
jgi:RNA polymerase sigma-70 factor (ECF subfamily)